jgi:hypothetical protein
MSFAFTVTPEMPPSDDPRVRHALRLAIGDLLGNVRPFQDGLLTAPAPCLIAGLEYVTPWTRDAAFNVWFALSRLAPQVATHTLLAVLERTPSGAVRIGGQYWDAIIWAHGAWAHYTVTRDRTFLSTAHDAVRHSLTRFEAEEFDPADGLFRGGACFQDGVAAYPDFFAPGPGDPPFSGIDVWTEVAAHKRFPSGGGIPCKALSTNCLYYRAYQVALLMAAELGVEPDATWTGKAAALRAAIHTRFWSEKLGRYRYLVDAPGEDDRQEGLGLAFALLFDVAARHPLRLADLSALRRARRVWPPLRSDLAAGQRRVGAGLRGARPPGPGGTGDDFPSGKSRPRRWVLRGVSSRHRAALRRPAGTP